MLLFKNPIMFVARSAWLGRQHRGISVGVGSNFLPRETAQIIGLPYSHVVNLWGDSWQSGGPSDHDLSPLFRPDYTGPDGIIGDGLTATMPGYYVSTLIEPTTPMAAMWAGPHRPYLSGADPRSATDLAGKSALLLMIGDYLYDPQDFGDPADYFSRTGEHMIAMNGNLAVAKDFIAAAIAQGLDGVLIYGQQPFLADASTATDDASWRDQIAVYERAHHWMRDKLVAWLAETGNASFWLRIIPAHRYAARLYDDIENGVTIPGSPTTHRYFRSEYDSSGGASTHVYMLNDRGVWGTQYLFNQVTFGSSPTPTTTYVDAALAGYLSGIGDDIIGSYAYAGHGGADTGEMGMPELTGARPSEIMAAATTFEVDILTTPLWQDTARTIPAVDGDPVAAIGSVLTAAGVDVGTRSGDALVVSTTATSDIYTGTMPAAIAPRYVAILMDLVDMTGDEGCMVKVGGLDLLRFSSGWIRADVPGGSVAVQATDLGFGGRRVLYEYIHDDDSGLSFIRLTNLARADGERLLYIAQSDTAAPAATNDIRLVTNRFGEAKEERLSYVFLSDTAPSAAERLQIYDWISNREGVLVW